MVCSKANFPFTLLQQIVFFMLISAVFMQFVGNELKQYLILLWMGIMQEIFVIKI